MKAVQIILAVAFLLGASAVSAQDKKTNRKEEQVVFSVNMDCHSCEQKVKKNIPYERGVVNLTTDLEKQLVTVKYRTNRTDKAKLKAAIEKLGFTCEEVKKQEG
jgi:copper chaperone CopZ